MVFSESIAKKIPYVIGLFFLALYILTLSPTLNFIDSGELAAVCSVLGIAHPTGYPLFTLLGFLVTRFPLFGSEVYTLNLMCAIFCAVSLYFFLRFNFELHRHTEEPDTGKTKKKEQRTKSNSTSELVLFSSIAAVLSLGLSRNFWIQSTSLEVYPLHVLFVSVLLYLFIKNYNNPRHEVESSFSGELNGWLLFAFILGLSFTNHMTTIFLLPAFAFLFFCKYKFKKSTFKVLFILLIPFIVGLSLYLYLPLRASSEPILNWGDPSSYFGFKSHISGKQYSIWIFSSFAEMKQQFIYFFKVVPDDYLYFPALLSLPGVWLIYKRRKDYFYFTIILFLTCFLLAINYSIVDIDSYFLLAYFVLSVWIGYGILWFYNVLTENNKQLKKILLLLFAIIPLIQIVNYSKADESNNYLVEDYTMNLLNSVSPGGVVISYQWDNWISASYYFQHVKGLRKDIVVIDKELCRRSWYIKQLRNIYPEFMKKSEKEVNEFLAEVYKFEHDLPYDGLKIEEKFIGMLNSFIEKNIGSVNVYVTDEIEKEIGKGYKRIPEGLVYRLHKEVEYFEHPPLDMVFRPLPKKGKYPAQLLNFYGVMLTNRASYENYFNHKEKALKFLDKLREINPEYGPAITLRRIITQNTDGK